MDEVPRRRERERDVRRAGIVDTAERLFLEHDYESCSMDEIAQAAEFTKRTIYQYFPRKEDLFFAVAVRQLRKYPFPDPSVPSEGRSSVDRLRFFNETFYATCRDHAAVARIVHDAFLLKDRAEASPNRMEFERETFRLYENLVGTMRLGAADGSIRADVEPEKAAFTFIFFLVGFLGMITARHPSFGAFAPLPLDEQFRYSNYLMLESVRAR